MIMSDEEQTQRVTQPQPQPQISPQQFLKAYATGKKMLESETICTPNAWNEDLMLLSHVLEGLITGNLVLAQGAPPPEK